MNSNPARSMQPIPPAKWMQELPMFVPGRRLVDIIMPGTHDAGSYAITPKSEPSEDASTVMKIGGFMGSAAVQFWSQSQSCNLATQFAQGVRYFDLRVWRKILANGQKEFWLYHTFLSAPLRAELSQLKTQLTQSGKEIVILDVSLSGVNLTGEDHQALLKELQTLPPIATTSLGPTSIVQQFWDAGTNVIVLYKDAWNNLGPDAATHVWDRVANLRSKWFNRQKFDDLHDDLIAELQQQPVGQPSQQLWVAQAVLTPDTDMIAKGVLGTGYYKSLAQIAHDINPKVAELIDKVVGGHLAGHRPNIVMVDFFDVGGIADLCIRANAR